MLFAKTNTTSSIWLNFGSPPDLGGARGGIKYTLIFYPT